MSQNTFKRKLKEGNTQKGGSRGTVFSWIEEKLDLTSILGEGVPVQFVPPVVFLVILALIYIYSNHRAESMVRRIEKMQQEVEDIRAEVTTLESEYMQSSMQSEVAKRAALLTIYELDQPPIKIEVNK